MPRRNNRRARLPADPVTLKIQSLSHEGRGVGQIDGKVTFVEGALPEELVSARYVRRRGQYDEMRVEEVLEASANRVAPPCEYAGTCGGCSLQHLGPANQIEFKESVLLEHLARECRLQPEDFTVLPRLQAQSQNYRRKARLAVRYVAKKGGALVGFREKNGSFITDMTSCKVLSAEVSNLIKPLRQFITELDGARDIPQIEVAVGENPDDSLVVALVFRHMNLLSEKDIASLENFASQWGCEIYLQPGNPESVTKLAPSASVDRMHYYLPAQDIQFAFHPMDFTQINAEINRMIVSRTLDILQLGKDDEVLDLFCGLGNFTLPIAAACKQVVGVEGSQQMVERGTENMRANQLENIEFHMANLFEPIDTQPWYRDSINKIVLDPPRSGAIEIMPAIAALKPERIVYISCNPATLARDAAQLIAKGFELKSAGVMDMFPHTAHVESMAVFEPGN